MNPTRLVLAAFAVLLLAGGALLWRLSAGQALGAPGVRVGPLMVLAEDGAVVSTNGVLLPVAPLGWASDVPPITKEELDMLPPDTTYGRRRYTAPDGFTCAVNVVLMGADRTSIHKPEYCLPGQGFRIVSQTPEVIRMEKPHPYDLPVRRIVAERTARLEDGREVTLRALYVFWFMSDARITDDHLTRMWWMTEDVLRTGTLPRWAYASYFSVGLPGQEEAIYRRIVELIRATVPEFQVVAGPPAQAMAAARSD